MFLPRTANYVDPFPSLVGSSLIPLIKSRGRTIVERSFKQSWRDLTTLCPIVHYPNVTELPPSRQFYDECIGSALQLGNKEGSVYHSRWPWWFRTLLRDSIKRGSGISGKWHVLQFLSPDIRLCVYEKGGTKEFKKFHCQHIHNYTGEIPNFNQCWNKQPSYRLRPDSDKAVFLRDPLDRFLSGFLDKCIRHNDVVDHCEPVTVFYNQSTSPVSDMLWDKKLFFEMFVDTMPLQWNMHFIPQSLYCNGLYRDIHQYAFVGNMGESFYQDLGHMVSRYPNLERGVERIFKLTEKRRANVTNTRGVETGAASKVQEYYKPHTVRRVLEYYAIDYIMLNLSIPEWAEKMLREHEENNGNRFIHV